MSLVASESPVRNTGRRGTSGRQGFGNVLAHGLGQNIPAPNGLPSRSRRTRFYTSSSVERRHSRHADTVVCRTPFRDDRFLDE